MALILIRESLTERHINPIPIWFAMHGQIVICIRTGGVHIEVGRVTRSGTTGTLHL